MVSFQSRSSFSLPLPFLPVPTPPGAEVVATWPCAEMVRPRTRPKRRRPMRARERRKGDIVRVLDEAGRAVESGGTEIIRGGRGRPQGKTKPCYAGGTRPRP